MNDETLTLYYYNDGLSARERLQVEAALREDVDLAERYNELRSQLLQMREFKVHAAPSDVVRRWHDSIDRAADMEPNKHRQATNSFNFMSFFWGATVTAALAIGIGIGIGVYFSGNGATTSILPGGIATFPEATIPAAFTRGLQVHLRDSQREISRLAVDSGAERAVLIP